MLKENKIPYVHVEAVNSNWKNLSHWVLFSLYLCQVVPPYGKMEQMLRQIDPTNEMALPETEVISTHQNYRFTYTTRQEMMAE